MAEKLKEVGFELIEGKAHLNLSQREMKRLIRAFGNSLRGGGVGVFFFAGHGVQLKGKGNFLLPVDIAVENEADVEDLAVSASLVLDNMAYAENGLNIIILDACRNNPFDGRGMRALDGGLARMEALSGTLIAYAAAPGRTAGDNPKERNGTYTTELLKKLGQPNLSTLDMFQEVGAAVYANSQRKQDPWIEGTPRSRFCFGGCENAVVKPMPEANNPVPAVTLDRVALEKEAWEVIRNSRNLEDFQDYLEEVKKGTYPGNYAAIARSRVRELTARPPEVRPTREFRGSISGIITDTNGAWVVYATVTIKNLDTNLVITTQPNDEGAYAVLFLPPGKYSVTVTADNFKKFTKNIKMQVDTQLRVDATLEVGSSRVTVEVREKEPPDQ